MRTIPWNMTLPTNLLCVSWLEGRFKALACSKGNAVETWEAPVSPGDFAGLAALLREAADQTHAGGKQVALVLAHPSLSDQVLELPPAKGIALERFIQRRVGEIKTFNREAAWSCQPALPLKGAGASLVHLFPAGLLNQLSRACAEAGLQLVRVLPATAVLGGQLKMLPLAKEEVALLAAETGPATMLVIGRGDGRLCLSRRLGGNWNQNPEAMAVELTRTIGFAEQQAGVTVGSVWLFGAGAATRAAAIQSLLKRPVKVSPVECAPFYWASQAGSLPGKDDGNLISSDVREAPQRRVLLTVTGISLMVLLLASVGTAVFAGKLRRDDLQTIASLNRQIADQQQHQTDLTRQNAEADQKNEIIRVVSRERLAPVPASFISYLGDAVPDDLVLTRSRVVRTNDVWCVRLEGVAQPGAKEAQGAAADRAFAALTNRLVTGPFHVAITGSPAGPAGENQFVIEGELQ
jgi:hypothetical protein